MDCDGTLTADDCDDNNSFYSVCFEPVAIGFEFVGTWDQPNDRLGGWIYNNGDTTEPYVMVHITNDEYFTVGAGTNNENICTIYMNFIHQSAALNTQEYDYTNPPTSYTDFPLGTTATTPWASYEGYLTSIGYATNTVDTCASIKDEYIVEFDSTGVGDLYLDGMHFGVSYGGLTTMMTDNLEEEYVLGADNDNNGLDDYEEYLDNNIDGFATQYIHVNHYNSTTGMYDFTGYDWNYSRLSYLNTDGTISETPCSFDTNLNCYDLVQTPYDGSLDVFTDATSYWFEDIFNLDMSILHEGVPTVNDMDGDGFTTADGDCDDSNSFVYPGAMENPGDGLDWDCDGMELCYVDDDGDGYGTTATIMSSDVSCQTTGFSASSADCNDADSTINPGATDTPNDGVDQDCDGSDSAGSTCSSTETADCNGICAPTSWLGDGYCDDGAYSYLGNDIYFDCAQFNNDNGDC